MSFSRGKISVCMATYNGERFIKEQLDSILIQISSDDEVVISDDGSTDNTLRIIENFNDARIKVFHHRSENSLKPFEKVTANFENAMKYAQGYYLFLADQDDIWLPNKVKICIKALESYNLVLHDCKVGDENLQIIYNSYFEFNKSKKGIIANICKNSYLGCCMAFTKDVFLESFPIASLGVPHDIWVGLTAELNRKVIFLKEPLIIFRRHGKNISYSGEKSYNSFNYKISYRLKLISQFIKHIYR